jgi:maltose phosphorylase
MKQRIQADPWKIIEDGFHPKENRFYESVMSLGNGHMGMRGNFEEDYSGDSLSGTYLAGVYYPDKTRVGWWKNGYPEYFAKVLNAVNFLYTPMRLNGVAVDLAKEEFSDFTRVLNMQTGLLTRTFTIVRPEGKVKFTIERFVSTNNREIAAIRFQVEALEGNHQLEWAPGLNQNVRNEDSNYEEVFWESMEAEAADGKGFAMATTKKTEFVVGAAMAIDADGATLIGETAHLQLASLQYEIQLEKGVPIFLDKIVAVLTNRDHKTAEIKALAYQTAANAKEMGYDQLRTAHIQTWSAIWQESDIEISGDDAAQQGIRFNLFHLKQTYNGLDPRLNIGPKGFTGEKYGGSTYWDTEAFCIPVFLSTAKPEIARNLLIYRHRHLEKAVENANKLGVKGALYPMVTMNGEECHNEWEITFEEIHRNAAIAYAIYQYVLYTGDRDYLLSHGLDVLIEISRFWANRANWSEARKAYVLLGVTGPNEYDNNVNNNWYTNRMAKWTLHYTQETIASYHYAQPQKIHEILARHLVTKEELQHWQSVEEKMFEPKDNALGIFLQQDGYLDKEQRMAADLDPAERPLNQNWSWDRILRSCFIKQADVLQGLFVLGDLYSTETKERNFDFYEPRTVHESSLSPCVHSILAVELGRIDKAMEMFHRAARLDLDDYNNDTDDGLHITSMGGTWMNMVYGFGGLRVKENGLYLTPVLPKEWTGYSFVLRYRGSEIKISRTRNELVLQLLEGKPLHLRVWEKDVYCDIDGVNIPIVS